MPINQLQKIENTNKQKKPGLVQEVINNPFSLKTLLFSLFSGLAIAVIVTGIITLYRNLTSNSVNKNISQQVAEVNQEEDTKNKAVISGEIFIDLTKLDSDKDGLFDWEEAKYGTDPYLADTDFDGFEDKEEFLFGYDPTGFGRPDTRIIIDKLNLTAPVIYPDSTEESDIQAAMTKGVAHYPGTAVPGANGNIYITGHSSDYAWNQGEYKRVFRQLNDLEVGDKVLIEQTYNSGNIVTYKYQVYDKQVMPIDAEELWIADSPGSVLTLVTSWPIDSTRERLMVRGILIE